MKHFMMMAGPILVCASALAVPLHIPNFEPPAYSGSPGGTILTGQQGWYNPVAGSADYKVYTYAGNTYGIVQHPMGGTQFAGGRMEGMSAFARAQIDFNWAAQDYWEITYDIAVLYTGEPGQAADNLGSWSMQPSATARYFQSIFQWMDEPAATIWGHGYYTLEYPATAAIPWWPSPNWQNLQVNHWYRFTTNIRMSTQEILQVSIQDLHTGWSETVVLNPPQHFMNPTGPLPTAYRFFTGGGAGSTPAGNFVAWDIPEPASLALLLVGVAVFARRR